MSDQAAGLRARLSPGAICLRVVGEPGDDALRRALAALPAPEGRTWLAQGEHETGMSPAVWLLWVDTVRLDVADLYRRLKLAVPAGRARVPVLCWLYDSRDGTFFPTLDPDSARLLDNLGVTAARFLGIELIRDPASWLGRYSSRVRASAG
ncbi:hypothetical protein [Salinicola acroporae]|uniref:DUF4123 domain-containing protein n=1 Tax=Salinicola acroporae TaxID=1541440 RepID=A0ABT6I3K8_9GAMM|nr:hypothetical protein [Salinicola acroporae]MDH4572106.1 hypothetical protein [Salinicola acroporae]